MQQQIIFKEYLDDSLINSYENRERTLRDFLFLSSSFAYQHLFNSDKEHYISLTSTYNLYDGKEDAQAEFFSESQLKQLGGNRNTEIGPTNAIRISLDYQYPMVNNLKLQLGARTDFGFSSDDQDSYSYDLNTQDYFRLDSFPQMLIMFKMFMLGMELLMEKLMINLVFNLD